MNGSDGDAALGEFERIARYLAPLARGFPGAFGLLDDAALVHVPAGMQLVVTTDAMVCGRHFLADDPPEDIAHKLLAVNLSDLAAKGATPLCYSLTTALPGGLPEAWLARFAAGLAEGQRRWGWHLIGGDSVATDGPIVLSVCAQGVVPEGTLVRRAGARQGDLVCVTGTIGDAALGLRLALGSWSGPPPDPAAAALYLARLRRPEPRVELASILREFATAAVDVSDGLLADLGHLAVASGVALELDLARIPLSDAAATHVGRVPADLLALWTGGDDYEVAFTVDALRAEAIEAGAKAVGLNVARIGRVVSDPPGTVTLRGADGAAITVERSGWRHF